MSQELVDAAALAVRFVLAFVFVMAALPKILNLREFQRAVANYNLLPASLASAVALVLPPIELACGLFLLIGVGVTPVGIASAALLVAFAAAVGINLVRGRRIDCGCAGSVAPRTISWQLVAGDAALAAMATFAALVNPHTLALQRGSASPVSAHDGIALLVAAAAAVLGQHLLSSWRSFHSVATRVGES